MFRAARKSVSFFTIFFSPFPSNLIRASSVASTPSATISPTTCLVLGDFPPSKYSSTTLDGVPSRVSRIPNL